MEFLALILLAGLGYGVVIPTAIWAMRRLGVLSTDYAKKNELNKELRKVNPEAGSVGLAEDAANWDPDGQSD